MHHRCFLAIWFGNGLISKKLCQPNWINGLKRLQESVSSLMILYEQIESDPIFLNSPFRILISYLMCDFNVYSLSLLAVRCALFHFYWNNKQIIICIWFRLFYYRSIIKYPMTMTTSTTNQSDYRLYGLLSNSFFIF